MSALSSNDLYRSSLNFSWIIITMIYYTASIEHTIYGSIQHTICGTTHKHKQDLNAYNPGSTGLSNHDCYLCIRQLPHYYDLLSSKHRTHNLLNSKHRTHNICPNKPGVPHSSSRASGLACCCWSSPHVSWPLPDIIYWTTNTNTWYYTYRSYHYLLNSLHYTYQYNYNNNHK